MSTFNDTDCQSVCFGSAPQYDLVHLAGRLLRHGGAPTTLTDEQRLEVSRHPKLVEYRQKSAILLEKMKSRGYSSRAAAEGTELADQYDQYRKKCANLGTKLRRMRLQQAIKDFHDSIHIDEINQQLHGLKASSVIAPPTASYELPERAKIAQLFSQAVQTANRETLFQVRMDLVRTLAQLCMRRESPCRRPSRFHRTNSPDMISIAGPAVKTKRGRAEILCPFCRWADREVGECQRLKSWRIDSLARHIRTQHLKRISIPFGCPYRECSDVLSSPEHFASHMELRHQLRLPPAIISSV
jgi:hypothetical protein